MYAGKTDRNLVIHLNEQGSRDDQPMYQHLLKSEHYNNIANLMKLPDTDSTTVGVDKKRVDTKCSFIKFSNFGQL